MVALEILEACNKDVRGTLVPKKIEQVLIRLASPVEYQGDPQAINKVSEHLNRLLLPEGFKVILQGVTPRLESCEAGVAVPIPEVKVIFRPPPKFADLTNDPSLHGILSARWQEAQLCAKSGAYLSAVIMMGSILEGVLLSIVTQNPAAANRVSSTPMDSKSGKPKPFADWNLNTLINVAHECGWLQGDVKRFSDALRESRNMVHPWHQRALNEFPDEDTCNICWQVVCAAVNDLVSFAQKKKSGTA